MLTALMSGKALTASELAAEAGVTPQTASSHLSKLEQAGLLFQRKQGRHRYFALADAEVSGVLEALMGLAAKRGLMRTRTGPRNPALRKARVCYNHLAGELGVRLFDSMVSRSFLKQSDSTIVLTDQGRAFVESLDFDLETLHKERRPLCRSCLDWSARRTHLAGSLGAAFLESFYDRGWAKRLKGSRIVEFSRQGERRFLTLFPID